MQYQTLRVAIRRAGPQSVPRFPDGIEIGNRAPPTQRCPCIDGLMHQRPRGSATRKSEHRSREQVVDD